MGCEHLAGGNFYDFSSDDSVACSHQRSQSHIALRGQFAANQQVTAIQQSRQHYELVLWVRAAS